MGRYLATTVGFLFLFSTSVIADSPQVGCQLDFQKPLLDGDWEEIDRAIERCQVEVASNRLAESYCISVVAAIAALDFDILKKEHKNQISSSWSRVLRLRRRSLSTGTLPACDTEIAWHWKLYAGNGDRTRLTAIGELIKRYSASSSSQSLLSLFREFTSDHDAEVPGLDALATGAIEDPSICQIIAEFYRDVRVLVVSECPSTASTSAVRLVAVAIEMYRVDHNRYPDLSDGFEAGNLLTPIYFRKLPRNDVWGHELIVRSSASGYEVRSLGADGHRQDQLVEGKVSDPDADIVWRAGEFIQQHELQELP
jgi:hypothetical protein